MGEAPKENNNYLEALFYRIKNLRHEFNTTVLKNELTKWIDDPSYNNYYLNYFEYIDEKLIALYSDNISTSLKHNNDLVNTIIQMCNFELLDYVTLKPVVSFYNKNILDSNAMKLLSTCVWENTEITKYHTDGKRICLFNRFDKWYIAHSKKIFCLVDESFDKNKINKIFLDVILEKRIDINSIDKAMTYHFLLLHHSFKKIGYVNDRYTSDLLLLWICDNSSNLIESKNLCNELKTKVHFEKKLHFSCLDELLTSLEIMNNNDVINKTIDNSGYFVKIFSEDKKQYTCCALRTDLYKNILSLMPKHQNQYINFLELYQNDNLSGMLPYLHKYPADVVRRINVSIKTLSKEILNIYHLTRKKQNSDLYECLPIIYKKMLYDLHKIYVNQKYGDYIIKSEDILKEKKSISVDIVYNYLKEMKNNELVRVFEERKKLIECLTKIGYLYDHILCTTNIDLITQTELMFMN